MRIDELNFQYGLSEKQALSLKKVSMSLGMPIEKVIRLSYIETIDLLCAKIELKQHLLDSIETFLEVHKR